MKRYMVAVAIVTAGIATAGCSSANSSSSKPSADAGAQLACEHFRGVVHDASAGILTPSEERTKIKEVYDSAKVSADAGIADGAQAMLAAITTGDGSTFGSAGDAFLNACQAVGQ